MERSTGFPKISRQVPGAPEAMETANLWSASRKLAKLIPTQHNSAAAMSVLVEWRNKHHDLYFTDVETDLWRFGSLYQVTHGVG
jgi:hypothetical protein